MRWLYNKEGGGGFGERGGERGSRRGKLPARAERPALLSASSITFLTIMMLANKTASAHTGLKTVPSHAVFLPESTALKQKPAWVPAEHRQEFRRDRVLLLHPQRSTAPHAKTRAGEGLADLRGTAVDRGCRRKALSVP